MKIGKIYSLINQDIGYIIDEKKELYLFFLTDFIDDTKIEVNTLVKFNASISNDVKRATYICKYNID